jgi:TetR/AcrR family transcriptional regulator, transcriptional repressor for nem operon
MLDTIRDIIEEKNSSIQKLLAISDFYKNNYLTKLDLGGCPILNVGVDANHTNPKLYEAVKQVVVKI